MRPIEVQQPLDLGDGRALRRGRLAPTIQQAVIAVARVAEAQTPDAARAAPEDVGGLQPGELPTECSQDDFLDLHGTLHGADGVAHGHLLGDQFSPGARLERSSHVALGSGQVTYSRHRRVGGLTRPDAADSVGTRWMSNTPSS